MVLSEGVVRSDRHAKRNVVGSHLTAYRLSISEAARVIGETRTPALSPCRRTLYLLSYYHRLELIPGYQSFASTLSGGYQWC